MTRFLGKQLAPSPPYFVQDFGSSVLDQVLMPHAMTSDTVFVSRTTFRRRDGGALNGNVFVIPTTDLKEAIQGVLAG
jgi:chemotaxis protein CheC